LILKVGGARSMRGILVGQGARAAAPPLRAGTLGLAPLGFPLLPASSGVF